MSLTALMQSSSWHRAELGDVAGGRRGSYTGLWPQARARGGTHRWHARRGGAPLYLQGRVRLPRLVATLDEPEVQNQVPGGPQGRHGPDERPGRMLDHRARGPAGG